MSGALEVAEEIFTRATREDEWRAVASRAYFASYQHTLRHPKIRDFIPRKQSDDHRRLIEHLKVSMDPALRRVGHILHRLRSLRNQADYDLEFPFRRTLAKEALERASEVIYDFLLLP